MTKRSGLYLRRILTGSFLVCFLSMMVVKGQDVQKLEKLVEKSETLLSPKISDNGKWAAWYSYKNDSKERQLIIGSIENAKRKYFRKSIDKWTFGNNCIAVISAAKLEVLSFRDGRSVHFENVRSAEYFKKQDMLIVRYDAKQNNRVEAYDSNMKKIFEVENVCSIFGNDHLFVVAKTNNGNEIFSLEDKQLNKIRSTPNEILEVLPSGISSKGFIISEKKKDGLAVVYISRDLKVIELDDPKISGFEKVKLEASKDDKNVFLNFSKLVRPKKEDVQIWYGNEQVLGNYISGFIDYYKVIWNPLTNLEMVVSQKDFERETSVGKAGLILKLLKDKKRVEARDPRSGRGFEKLFLWDALTGENAFLADSYGKIVIHPDGNYIAVTGQSKWMLHKIPNGTSFDLDMPVTSVPYFSGKQHIFWLSDGKLVMQDMSTLNKKVLADFGNAKLELINPDIQMTSLGYGKDFGSVDLTKPLLLKISYSDQRLFQYIQWKNGKTISVVDKTADHISEFRKAEDSDSFIWVAENYNKAPVVMTKIKSASATVYLAMS